MRNSEMVKVFLLGMIAATLIISTLQPQSPGFAFAGRSSNGANSGEMMALVGPKDATLFLIDTKNKNIAHYETQGSRGVILRAGRHYGYDTQLFDRVGYMKVDEARALARKDRQAFLKHGSEEE